MTIGDNVYFAMNYTILKGKSIDDNCMVEIGSIVTMIFRRTVLRPVLRQK